ncbi:MAG: hypothetical protein ACM3XN_10440 [Chloroflexota bacterium]
MLKKALPLLLIAFMVFGVSSIGEAATPSIVPIKIRMVDDNGAPTRGTTVELYGHAKDRVILLSEGVTGDDGSVSLEADLKKLAVRHDLKDYVFEIHAIQPGGGLTIQTWAVGADGIKRTTVKEVSAQVGPSGMAALQDASTTTAYRTIQTASPYDFNSNVKVQQLHYVPNLNVQVNYTTETSTGIESGMRYTWPSLGTWSYTGSVQKSTSTAVSWATSALRPYCQWVSTRFLFRESYWALQEEDGDIPGVWHTIQEWKEITVLSHSGGNYYGPQISGSTCSTCLKPIDDVLSRPTYYGTAFEIFTPGSVTKTVTGSISTSWSYDSGDFDVTASYASNTSTSHVFSHSDPNSRYAAYDMLSGSVYYVTKAAK